MEWKPEWTLAMLPIAGAVLASIVMVAFGAGATAAQWGAIVTFLVLLPFCISRLLDRGR